MKSAPPATKREQAIEIQLAVIRSDLNYIKEDVGDIKHKLESNYVTLEQFEPVKKIVYGMVSVVLLAVIGAVVALVINK